MKMIKLLKLRTLMLMLVLSSAMILGVGSCNNDDDDDSNGGKVDKKDLTALITRADSLSNAATSADYPQADIDSYKATLKTVKDAAATELNQVQVNNLVTQLNASMMTFRTKAFAFINESLYLVAGWHFDEGTGSTATSFSSGKQVGTFSKGWTTLMGANGAMPTWVDGAKGKAVYLTKGAHLEVPYSPSFLPANISIAAWIKMDKIWENDVIVSQNYWWGYKFQTQSAGKPLFTQRISATDVQDFDSGESSVNAGVWTHVAVSLDSSTKTLKFFIDGVMVRTLTAADNVGALTQTLSYTDADYAYTPQPFLIGSFATDTEIALHPNNFSWITTANVGSFEGAIDELRLYNIALSDGQVAKLYNDEKPKQ